MDPRLARLFTNKAPTPTTTIAYPFPIAAPALSLRDGACQGNISLIEKALTRGEKINDQSELSKDTALHLASSKGHLEAVKYLVSQGAVTKIENANKKTPLSVAEDNAHTAIIFFLNVINVCHEAKQHASTHVAKSIKKVKQKGELYAELSRVGMLFIAEKLKDSGLGIHQLSGRFLLGVDHTVLIIGLPVTFKLLDISTWGDAIICDFDYEAKCPTIYSASYPPSKSFIANIELIDKLALTPCKMPARVVKTLENQAAQKPSVLAKPR